MPRWTSSHRRMGSMRSQGQGGALTRRTRTRFPRLTLPNTGKVQGVSLTGACGVGGGSGRRWWEPSIRRCGISAPSPVEKSAAGAARFPCQGGDAQCDEMMSLQACMGPLRSRRRAGAGGTQLSAEAAVWGLKGAKGSKTLRTLTRWKRLNPERLTLVHATALRARQERVSSTGGRLYLLPSEH
jgi:hypothetical protein